MNTSMAGFRWFSKFCMLVLWMNVASTFKVLIMFLIPVQRCPCGYLDPLGNMYDGASVNGRKKYQNFFCLFWKNGGEKNLNFFSAVHTCTIVNMACVNTYMNQTFYPV